MAVRMIRREVRLSVEDRALLDKIVAERGITRAAWIREKIAEEREAAAREKGDEDASD